MSRRSSSKSGISVSTTTAPFMEKDTQRFNSDIEKQIELDESKNFAFLRSQKYRILVSIFTIGLICVCGGVFTSYLSLNPQNGLDLQNGVEKFEHDQIELLSKVLDDTPNGGNGAAKIKQEIPNKVNWNTKKVSTKSKEPVANNLDSEKTVIPLGTPQGKSWSEGGDKNKPAAGKSAGKAAGKAAAAATTTTVVLVNNDVQVNAVKDVKQSVLKSKEEPTAKDETVNPRIDLEEMLSVSPMTILLHSDTEREKHFTHIMKTLSIVPQPAVVNLKKHPHYKQIIHYLQNYQNYATDESKGKSSAASLHKHYDKSINDDDPLEDDTFVRVFIDAAPIANMEEIISMYDSKQLVAHLKAKGKGSITVG